MWTPPPLLLGPTAGHLTKLLLVRCVVGVGVLPALLCVVVSLALGGVWGCARGDGSASG